MKQSRQEPEISIDQLWDIKACRSIDSEYMEPLSPLKSPKNIMSRNKSFGGIYNLSPVVIRDEPFSPVKKKFILSVPMQMETDPLSPGLPTPARSKMKDLRISNRPYDYLKLNESRKGSGLYNKFQINKYASLDLERSSIMPSRGAMHKPQLYKHLDDVMNASLVSPLTIGNKYIRASNISSVRKTDASDLNRSQFPSPIRPRFLSRDISIDS